MHNIVYVHTNFDQNHHCVCIKLHVYHTISLHVQIALVSRFTVSRPDGFFLAVSICSITIILTGAAMVSRFHTGYFAEGVSHVYCD